MNVPGLSMNTMTDISSLEAVHEPAYATSGQPPFKKRRRPALSCEQCRKRKIKCNRIYPCNHCTQSKSAICTYSSDNAQPLPRVNGSPHQATFPSRPKKNPSSISGHLSSEGASPSISTQVSQSISGTIHTPADTDDEGLSRQDLLDRIRSLESKLTAPSSQNEFTVADSRTLFCNFKSGQTLAAPATYEGKNLRGTVSKTRFFGQSHWMYSYGAFERIACLTIDPATSSVDFPNGISNSHDIAEVGATLEECKSIARAAKAGPHQKYLQNQNYRDSIPPRAMADKLVNLYLRTSESIYRILHIPTFQREYLEYWENPRAASTVFVMKLMLVMSIGACFYQGTDSANFHDQALQWIFAAQSWLSTPFEKGRLHISGVQIHCLVLVARLDNAVAGDLIWISAGALLRVAFQMGFHHDPSHLPPVSQLHTELRRRLWATIIELNCQSALDSGMPPLMSMDDYDTEPPANIDDIDIDEKSDTRAISKPFNVYTQTSLQILLGKSMQSRLKVIRHANTVRRDATYDEALAVGKELSQALKENNAFVNRINSSSTSPHPISQLDRNLLDLSVRRFLIPVHRPFAAKADPRYYFSRKVCLDCSMTILSYPSSDSNTEPASPGYHDDYTWLKTMSGGFQKGFIVHAAMIIFNELLTQIDEDDGNSTTATTATREPLKQTLRDIIALVAERIKLVENNVKGHVFISIVLAQVEALEKGENVEIAVIGAAKKSLAICIDLLKERIRKSLTEDEYAAIVDRNAPNPLVHGEATDNTVESRITKGILSSDSVTAGLNGMNGMGGVGAGGIFNFGSGMGMGDQEWGNEFGMQDWNAGSGIDVDFTMPDSWLLSGWEDGGGF